MRTPRARIPARWKSKPRRKSLALAVLKRIRAAAMPPFFVSSSRSCQNCRRSKTGCCHACCAMTPSDLCGAATPDGRAGIHWPSAAKLATAPPGNDDCRKAGMTMKTSMAAALALAAARAYALPALSADNKAEPLRVAPPARARCPRPVFHGPGAAHLRAGGQARRARGGECLCPLGGAGAGQSASSTIPSSRNCSAPRRKCASGCSRAWARA